MKLSDRIAEEQQNERLGDIAASLVAGRRSKLQPPPYGASWAELIANPDEPLDCPLSPVVKVVEVEGDLDRWADDGGPPYDRP